jgi:hypothetical protein
MSRGQFAKYDAVAAAGPIGWDHVHLKAGGGDFVNQDLSRNAMLAVILGDTLYWSNEAKVARREIDNSEDAAGLQRTEDTGMQAGPLRESGFR